MTLVPRSGFRVARGPAASESYLPPHENAPVPRVGSNTWSSLPYVVLSSVPDDCSHVDSVQNSEMSTPSTMMTVSLLWTRMLPLLGARADDDDVIRDRGARRRVRHREQVPGPRGHGQLAVGR